MADPAIKTPRWAPVPRRHLALCPLGDDGRVASRKQRVDVVEAVGALHHVAAARGDAADDAEVAEGGADEEGGAARDVCNEELHRHVLAVHVPVDIVADRLRHLARVRLEIVDVQKGRLRQHDRVLAVPPDVPPAVVLQPPAPPDVQPRVEADEGALRVPPRLKRQREVVARSLDVVVDGEDGARAERGQRREAAVERVRQHVKLHPRRAIDAGSSANAPPVGGRRRPSLGPHHAHGVDHVALGVVLHRTPQHIGPLERVEHRRHTLVRRPRVAAAGLVPRVPLRGRRGAEREALPQGSRNGG
mmetsp:Transcript_15403/g.45877  ORF Transcript_15403/g.45877 Transcript_15403/m.45877 type:complete len:303 (+) Transcript_15403:695-1603(+)